MTFTNRELATLIWLGIFACIILAKHELRKSLFAVVSVFFSWQLQFLFWMMVAYITCSVFLLSKIGLWEPYLLKETLLWSILVPFPLLIRFASTSRSKHEFSTYLTDSISLAILIQFLTNVYSFALFIELILIPVAVFIGGGIAISENKSEFRSVHTLLTRALFLLGLIFFCFALYKIWKNPDGIANIVVIHEFFLTPFLSVLYWPFLYLLGLWFAYEVLFRSAKHFLKGNDHLLPLLRRGLLVRCKMDLNRVIRARQVVARELTVNSDARDVMSIIQLV